MPANESKQNDTNPKQYPPKMCFQRAHERARHGLTASGHMLIRAAPSMHGARLSARHRAPSRLRAGLRRLASVRSGARTGSGLFMRSSTKRGRRAPCHTCHTCFICFVVSFLLVQFMKADQTPGVARDLAALAPNVSPVQVGRPREAPPAPKAPPPPPAPLERSWRGVGRKGHRITGRPEEGWKRGSLLSWHIFGTVRSKWKISSSNSSRDPFSLCSYSVTFRDCS